MIPKNKRRNIKIGKKKGSYTIHKHFQRWDQEDGIVRIFVLFTDTSNLKIEFRQRKNKALTPALVRRIITNNPKGRKNTRKFYFF